MRKLGTLALLLSVSACGGEGPALPSEATSSASSASSASGGAGGSGGADSSSSAASGGQGGHADPDGDGISGAEDGCPEEAEDVDGVEDEDGCPDPGDGGGVLPPRPPKAGVAYAAHYLSQDLRAYRLDGELPEAAGEVPMAAVSHDLALDPVRDLLFVVHDTTRRVEVYAASRPASPSEPLALPSLVATIETPGTPYFARVNPYTNRLYVVQTPPDAKPPLESFELLAYDVSDPTSPVPTASSPHEIPSTTSFDLDPVRNVLFVVHGLGETLHAYDLAGDELRPLPGGPLDLAALYPEDNNFAFQARNLTADPETHRLYAARPQSFLSELLVLDYPAPIPQNGARYGQLASTSAIQKVEDAFDLQKPADERPHLTSAFTPLPDAGIGAVFLVAASGDASGAGALVAPMGGSPLTLGPGCENFEGFGCFFRAYAEGQPLGHLGTDGAACIDAERRVVVGTSVAPSEKNPGSVLFFRYEPDLSMTPWLPASGSNPKAGALPNGIVCH